jgi:hypothetical protein
MVTICDKNIAAHLINDVPQRDIIHDLKQFCDNNNVNGVRLNLRKQEFKIFSDFINQSQSHVMLRRALQKSYIPTNIDKNDGASYN